MDKGKGKAKLEEIVKIKKDLKSKSENKHKKFYKKFLQINSNSNTSIYDNNNGPILCQRKGIESLEEFKNQLKESTNYSRCKSQKLFENNKNVNNDRINLLQFSSFYNNNINTINPLKENLTNNFYASSTNFNISKSNFFKSDNNFFTQTINDFSKTLQSSGLKGNNNSNNFLKYNQILENKLVYNNNKLIYQGVSTMKNKNISAVDFFKINNFEKSIAKLENDNNNKTKNMNSSDFNYEKKEIKENEERLEKKDLMPKFYNKTFTSDYKATFKNFRTYDHNKMTRKDCIQTFANNNLKKFNSSFNNENTSSLEYLNSNILHNLNNLQQINKMKNNNENFSPINNTSANCSNMHKTKTSGYINQIGVYGNFDETDIKRLLSYYCINGDDMIEEMNKAKNNEDNDESEYREKLINKTKTLQKFDIDKDRISLALSEEEKKITNFLEKNKMRIVKANNAYNNIFNKLIQAKIHSSTNLTVRKDNEHYFSDPINSLEKINFNKSIHDKIMGLRNSKQIELYMEKFAEESDKNRKSIRMKNVKESLLHSDENKDEYLEVPIMHEGEISNENFDYKSPMLKQMSRDVLFSCSLEFIVSYNKDLKLKPFARSQFSLVLDGTNLIMFGGISGEMLYQTWICDLKNNFSWKKIGLNEDESPNPRYGHTAVIYRKEVFIYGGITPKEYFKPKEDILIYNLNKNKYYSEKIKPPMEHFWRKNHVAHAIGNLMVLHGGILENGKITNDLAAIEFDTLKMNRLEYSGISPYLAFHCSDFVLDGEKTNNIYYNIYKGLKTQELKLVYRIKHEGIYFFGGLDEENNYRNDLYILKVGRKPLEWIQPKTNGISPSARILATLNFYQELNILILHGGRNDRLKQSIFSDIWVFDLENFKWIKAIAYPFNPKDRAEHSSVMFNNQLLILGGLNLKKYSSMDFFVVNADLYNNKFKEKEILKEMEYKNKTEKAQKIESLVMHLNAFEGNTSQNNNENKHSVPESQIKHDKAKFSNQNSHSEHKTEHINEKIVEEPLNVSKEYHMPRLKQFSFTNFVKNLAKK